MIVDSRGTRRNHTNVRRPSVHDAHRRI